MFYLNIFDHEPFYLKIYVSYIIQFGEYWLIFFLSLGWIPLVMKLKDSSYPLEENLWPT